MLDHDSLPLHSDVLFCRSHGDSSLCDGFVCHEGTDCRSGCCGSFGSLKDDYCQPNIDSVCPAEGFTYGPLGDSFHLSEDPVETTPKPAVEPEELFKIPKKGAKETVPEQEEEGSFWDTCKEYMWYTIMALVILIAGCCCCLYCCCCRGGSSHTHNSGYDGLAGGR